MKANNYAPYTNLLHTSRRIAIDTSNKVVLAIEDATIRAGTNTITTDAPETAETIAMLHVITPSRPASGTDLVLVHGH